MVKFKVKLYWCYTKHPKKKYETTVIIDAEEDNQAVEKAIKKYIDLRKAECTGFEVKELKGGHING